MSAYAALRSLTFASIITLGLVTAAWSSARNVAWIHDQDRGDVVWVNTAAN